MGGTWRIPLFNVNKYDVFIKIYDELNIISEYHRHEEYLKEQVIEYREIASKRHSLQINWVKKNETMGVSELMLFETLYFDNHEESKHLYIRQHLDRNLKIFVDRNDFKYTLEFIKIFERLFWDEMILPERVKSLELKYSISEQLDRHRWTNIDNENDKY